MLRPTGLQSGRGINESFLVALSFLTAGQYNLEKKGSSTRIPGVAEVLVSWTVEMSSLLRVWTAPLRSLLLSVALKERTVLADGPALVKKVLWLPFVQIGLQRCLFR